MGGDLLRHHLRPVAEVDIEQRVAEMRPRSKVSRRR
jgi:hypothetical protein